MSNEQKLLEIINQIHATDIQHGSLYSAWLAVEAVRAKLEKSAVDALVWQGGQMHPRCTGAVGADVLEGWFNRNGGADLARLAALEAGASALARHPGMDAARAALEPLCRERDSLVAQIESDRLALLAAQDQAEQALAAASERARIAAENDPAVRAAAAALAALTAKPEPPPPPFRGKIAIKAKDTDNVVGAILDGME